MLPATTSTRQQQLLRHHPYAPGITLAATALWCTYWFVHARGYWEDDAWIHLEFARSVSQGLGFAFNGRVVAGDTSPLWVLLLDATHTLVPGWLIAGKLLSVLGALFGLSGIYAFARRVAHHLLPATSAKTFSAALVLLIVINPYTCYWIFSGMEPLACAGVACWAVLTAIRESPTTLSFLVTCLLAGLGPLLRPEMFFLTLLLVLPIFGQWRRLPNRPSSKAVLAVSGLMLLAGPSLAWPLYSLHTFGHLLPNTNAAKRAAPGESVLLRLIPVYTSGLPVLLCGAAAGCVHLALHPHSVASSLRSAIRQAILNSPRGPATNSAPESRATLPLEGWIFVLWAAVATIFYLADHAYVQTRYVLITAPGLTAVVLALALRLSPRIGRLFYMAGVAAALAVSITVVVPLLRNKTENCRTNHQLALFLRDHLPPDAPVAVFSIGQIAFESQHPIIDTGGITRPAAIPYWNSPAAMTRWARSEGAQYYISAESPEQGAVPVFTSQAPFIGWTVHTSAYDRTAPVSVWKLPPVPLPQTGLLRP